MSIPRWLIDKRHKICTSCENLKQCTGKFSILDDAPICPKGILKSAEEEVSSKAWPSGVAPVSGCCDSALNYNNSVPSKNNPSVAYLRSRANKS